MMNRKLTSLVFPASQAAVTAAETAFMMISIA